jgi:hypothetical protein
MPPSPAATRRDLEGGASGRLEVCRDAGKRLAAKGAGVAGQQLGEHTLIPAFDVRYRFALDQRDRRRAQSRDLRRVPLLLAP